MRINTNVAALNSYNQLNNTNNKLSKSLERLSSGKRINGAADDAAGLAISEKMGSQTRGLAQAQRNAQDAISMNQTAEGALKESHSILQRMRELAVQSANDTNTSADRAEIQEEVNQLSKELTRISETTEFNTQKLLDGTLENTFQIGANEGQNMKLGINNMSAEALDVVSDTVAMGESGANITGVDADLDVAIEDYSVSAKAEGEIAASITGDEFEGIKDNIVNSITTTQANISKNSSDLELTNNEISFSDVDEFNWSDVDQGSTATFEVVRSGDDLIANLDATESGGSARTISSSDIIGTFDTDGNLNINSAYDDGSGNVAYNEHGVSFNIASDEAGSLADTESLEVDLAQTAFDDGTASTTNDMTAQTWKLEGNYNYTTGTVNSFTDITVTESALPEGAASLNITQTGATNDIKVEILDSTGSVLHSDDDLSFDSNNDLIYDNHGVSFTLDTDGSVTDFDATGLELATTKEETLELTVDGNTESITLDSSMDAATVASTIDGVSSLNAEVDGDRIKISSATTGDDSSLDITSAPTGIGFSTTDSANGSDSSLAFELTDSSGTVIDSQETVSNTDSVEFTTSDGFVKFDVKGVSSDALDAMSETEVSENFAASNFSREVAGIDVSSQESADSAISTIDDAIANVSSERSKLGAVQNRLEHTINNLNTAEENLTAAESRISDVDMAREMMNMSKQQILSQAGTAMMAQANQLPQGVLQLLG